MLEDDAVARQGTTSGAPSRGKLSELFPGKTVPYKGALPKQYRIGKGLSIFRLKELVRPTSASHLLVGGCVCGGCPSSRTSKAR